MCRKSYTLCFTIRKSVITPKFARYGHLQNCGTEHVYTLGVSGDCLNEMTQLQEDRGFLSSKEKSAPSLK